MPLLAKIDRNAGAAYTQLEDELLPLGHSHAKPLVGGKRRTIEARLACLLADAVGIESFSSSAVFWGNHLGARHLPYRVQQLVAGDWTSPPHVVDHWLALDLARAAEGG
jgi:hypothetical protein